MDPKRAASAEMTGVTPLRAVRRPRLQEGIVDQLRRLILDGALAAGTVLRQEHLARRLQVSRMPLREALIVLEREGLVRIGPSGAASVVSLGAREAREIMDIREMVDGLAARLLAERGIPPALDRELEGLARRMRVMATKDKHAYLTANVDFHVKIVEATGHGRLQQMIPLVRMSSEVVYITMQNQGARLRRSATEHSAVLAAIRSGDGDAAERLARAHVRAAAAHWIVPETNPETEG
jgi:DNA-binding GntR family transcriptional regulator